ncbi:MAG: rhodanese-like domain-containing protein [Bacteroidia bacterium]|nr:rhodanese-like domain-containing protein [Bacteroidia bacterium]
MKLDELIKSNKATIVDVRTREEFRGGNVAGSINIPLNEIPQRMDELKAIEQPIVLCCLSGGRSGQATMYLMQQGFKDVHNGGSWLDVNYYKNN